MKVTRSALTLLAAIAVAPLQPVFAVDAKPSEESVRQLLEAMHTGEALKETSAHIDDLLRASMKEAGGRPLNAEQEKIRDETRAKVIAVMKEQLDWSTIIEPIMVESYRNTFTPEEVNALLKFYRTPVGRSLADKLPAASQQTMQLMQQRIREMMPKIQQIVRDSQERIRAAGESGTEATQPSQSH